MASRSVSQQLYQALGISLVFLFLISFLAQHLSSFLLFPISSRSEATKSAFAIRPTGSILCRVSFRLFDQLLILYSDQNIEKRSALSYCYARNPNLLSKYKNSDFENFTSI